MTDTGEYYLDGSTSKHLQEIVIMAVKEAEEAQKLNAVPSVHCRMVFDILKNEKAYHLLNVFWKKNQFKETSSLFPRLTRQGEVFKQASDALEKVKKLQLSLGKDKLVITDSEKTQAEPKPEELDEADNA